MTSDERFMRRCLDLASNGMGHVSPNPLVGCVITLSDQIIGEGWHQKYGEAHAEVNAVASVKDPSLLSQATVYVNLEPCSHFGKTPPCADMLVAHGVKRVVIANVDSNHLVAGKGIAKLRAAGIQVETGVLEKEGRQLNRRFFTFMERQRPYVILKWAQTSDGFIAPHEGKIQVSGPLSKKMVHRWRSEEDVFLVGRRTAAIDNPQLNVRDWVGRNPIRAVIDPKLSLPASLHLFDGSQKTLIYNSVEDRQNAEIEWVKVSESNLLEDVVADLYRRRVLSVVVEGGTETLTHFIDQGLWDEARVFTSPLTMGTGVQAPALKQDARFRDTVGGDVLEVFQNFNANPLPLN